MIVNIILIDTFMNKDWEYVNFQFANDQYSSNV